MKKRMAALLFAGIMAASLAGCSSKPAETTAAATEAATEAAAETKAEETAAEEKAAETVKEAAKPDNFPKKNIKIIVPYDARRRCRYHQSRILGRRRQEKIILTVSP